MNSNASFAAFLERLKDGDEETVREMWIRCYPRVLALARKRLEGAPKRIADEEDVASDAIKSFCQAIQERRFPQLHDQLSMWKVLLKITSRKAIDLRRYEHRRQNLGFALVTYRTIAADAQQNLATNSTDLPCPLQLIEEVEQRLAGLDEGLRSVTVAKQEGYANHEIAAKFSISLRTVERRLSRVRQKWSENS
ncbi:hypothetical protein LOC68_26750 [Blastopirellula sp. JC732]|uniref:HTH luxR-type domain-containing protein n=1 Tax=Blastopirellula sediminis TaxID=2894196 RepID=A0A9X1MSL4_9BACT|nr:ECF-type sigma factor [Blastopirellula sediminis]MCC9604690.1 hypothetical protein [Blastopirellula sediminis]MCC9632011.1 hypothetical protein [Blastopirellula sediminis]